MAMSFGFREIQNGSVHFWQRWCFEQLVGINNITSNDDGDNNDNINDDGDNNNDDGDNNNNNNDDDVSAKHTMRSRETREQKCCRAKLRRFWQKKKFGQRSLIPI